MHCIAGSIYFKLKHQLATSDRLAFFIIVRVGYRINAGQFLALAKEIANFSPQVTDWGNDLSSFGNKPKVLKIKNAIRKI